MIKNLGGSRERAKELIDSANDWINSDNFEEEEEGNIEDGPDSAYIEG